jgi:hypothetical protein
LEELDQTGASLSKNENSNSDYEDEDKLPIIRKKQKKSIKRTKSEKKVRKSAKDRVRQKRNVLSDDDRFNEDSDTPSPRKPTRQRRKTIIRTSADSTADDNLVSPDQHRGEEEPAKGIKVFVQKLARVMTELYDDLLNNAVEQDDYKLEAKFIRKHCYEFIEKYNQDCLKNFKECTKKFNQYFELLKDQGDRTARDDDNSVSAYVKQKANNFFKFSTTPVVSWVSKAWNYLSRSFS